MNRFIPLGGGCIANASRVESSNGRYFLKWGAASVARTFGAEAEGLRALSIATSALLILNLFGTGYAGAVETALRPFA